MTEPVRRPVSDRASEPVRQPVLSEPTSDDTGWGDESAAEKAERDAEWYRRETPPHHGD